MSRHKKVIMSNQQRFTKRKLFLTIEVASYNEVTSLVDEGIAVDVVYLDLSRVFETIL